MVGACHNIKFSLCNIFYFKDIKFIQKTIIKFTIINKINIIIIQLIVIHFKYIYNV